MSQRPAPPPPPRYLEQCYPSSQKGGTLVAEDVTDLETHARRLCTPDGYRPSRSCTTTARASSGPIPTRW